MDEAAGHVPQHVLLVMLFEPVFVCTYPNIQLCIQTGRGKDEELRVARSVRTICTTKTKRCVLKFARMTCRGQEGEWTKPLDMFLKMFSLNYGKRLGMEVNPKPETRNPKPETRNPKPETRNPTPCTLNPTPYTLNPKPETGGGGDSEAPVGPGGTPHTGSPTRAIAR